MSGEKKYREEIDLVDYTKILWEQRKIILINVVTVTLLSLVISLIMPKTYTSSTVLMPPSSESGSDIFGALKYLPFGGILPKTKDETSSMIAILKSRTLLESVIRRFDLIKFYNTINMEYALESLASDLEIEVEKEGTIRISVDVDTDWFHPESDEKNAQTLSAEMAKYIVTQLDIINKSLQIEQASFHRIFIEERYAETINALSNAEDSLKAFQEEYNMIALPEQTLAAIESASSIKGQIVANEVKLGVLKATLNSSHPDIENIKKENIELNKKMDELEHGLDPENISKRNIFPAFVDVPDLGVRLIRLQREVEMQNTLFIFLTQQYEEAKIEESKDTPTIQILDDASIPERKSSPRRMLIVVISFSISLIITILYIFYNEDMKNKEMK